MFFGPTMWADWWRHTFLTTACAPLNAQRPRDASLLCFCHKDLSLESQLLCQHINFRPSALGNICLASFMSKHNSAVTPLYELGLKLLALPAASGSDSLSLSCNMGTWGNWEKATRRGHASPAALACSSHVSDTHQVVRTQRWVY